MRARVEVRDNSLWIRHVTDRDLQRILAAVPAGGRVRLRVAGALETFEKMKDRPDGPTPGLRPVTGSKGVWGQLYKDRRGEYVEVELIDQPLDQRAASTPSHWTAATAAERDAAWEAFKALSRAGWRSSERDATSLDRDDLHQR